MKRLGTAAKAALAGAVILVTAAPAGAQAFRGFAGNMAMGRVTMQPVDQQRRRAVAANARRAHRGGRGWTGSWGRAAAPPSAYARDPVLQARIRAAVRQELARRRMVAALR